MAAITNQTTVGVDIDPIGKEESCFFPANLDAAALSDFSTEDLNQLHSAVSTLFEVTGAFCAQPRFSLRTRAGAAIHDLNCLLADSIGAVLEEARGRSAVGDEALPRAWLLLRHEVERQDSFSDAARFGGELSASLGNDAVATSPCSEIEAMYREAKALFDTDRSHLTEEESDAAAERYTELLTRLVRAEPKSARDLAMQAHADCMYGTADSSDEFSDRMAALTIEGRA